MCPVKEADSEEVSIMHAGAVGAGRAVLLHIHWQLHLHEHQRLAPWRHMDDTGEYLH